MKNWWRTNGVFHGYGGCHDAGKKYYKNRDPVSPFFGQIVNVGCDNSRAASIIDVFTQYVESLQTMRRKRFRPGRTEHELLRLGKQI